MKVPPGPVLNENDGFSLTGIIRLPQLPHRVILCLQGTLKKVNFLYMVQMDCSYATSSTRGFHRLSPVLDMCRRCKYYYCVISSNGETGM